MKESEKIVSRASYTRASLRGPLFQTGKAKRRGLRRKKGSQPRLATLGSPFQGKGLAWTLPPLEGGAPKGRRLDGGSGMKESGKDRLKYAICESSAISISSERIHACVEKQYPRQSLPRVGKVASEASRIGY